jgi:hypothetical protein
MDELSKMKMMEQEEERESSHGPQPDEDNTRTDPITDYTEILKKVIMRLGMYYTAYGQTGGHYSSMTSYRK